MPSACGISKLAQPVRRQEDALLSGVALVLADTALCRDALWRGFRFPPRCCRTGDSGIAGGAAGVAGASGVNTNKNIRVELFAEPGCRYARPASADDPELTVVPSLRPEGLSQDLPVASVRRTDKWTPMEVTSRCRVTPGREVGSGHSSEAGDDHCCRPYGVRSR